MFKSNRKSTRYLRHYALTFVAAIAPLACDNDDPEEAALDAQAQLISTELDHFVAALTAIQTNAPVPDIDGWNASADAAAVAAMKSEWGKARDSYERIESAVATFFSTHDVSLDERYDGFIESLPAGDANLFDAQGVRGMHAVERILWADQIPPYVVAFESKLVGYVPAAFPQNQQQADDFRNKLVAQMIADATDLRAQYLDLAKRLKSADIYQGVFDSMAEQSEKIHLTSTGEAESRYANRTLADMKANLAGGHELYMAFSPWVREQNQGAALDEAVMAGFARLEAFYQQYPGDAMPEVPAGWNPDAPSAEHLATPYGQLWQTVTRESDLTQAGTLLAAIVAAGHALDFDLGVATTPGTAN
jgi:iron uptake system component EfeO